MAIDDMYNPDRESVSSYVKHKEEGGTRKELDEQNRQRILDELLNHSHPLTHLSASLYNINNGQVASGKLEPVFACLLIVGQKRNIELASVFQHELSPVPPSLIDE